MLHSKVISFVSFVFIVTCAGATTSKQSGWSSGGDANANSAHDYVLAGCTSGNWSSGCRGTYSDEGAVVLNIARKFNDNGGYFCPTQIQFANKNHKKYIWVDLYEPASKADCRWICKPGYTGDSCQTVDPGNICGTNSMTSLMAATQRTSGSNSNKVAETVSIFALSEHRTKDSNRDASITVLAIVAYYNHGVLVGRLTVNGTRDWNSGNISSWATGFTEPTEKFLLCDTGFRANATRTDCEPVSRDACGLAPEPMCDGWTKAEYTANETDFEYRQVGGCYQYRCMNRNKAFPNANNRVCTDCATGVRGGADKTTGVCKVCELGQYFDENTGECRTAQGFVRTDLQYGKDKTKNNAPADISQQCWTKVSPDEYKECVMGRTTTSGTANVNTTTSGTGNVINIRREDLLTLPTNLYNVQPAVVSALQ